MVNNPFFAPSDKATGKTPTAASRSATLWALIEENFKLCPPGMSFAVDNGDFTEATIRTLVSRKAKELGKSYSVVKHVGCYELYNRGEVTEHDA